LDLYPAIDLLDGRVVQLVQGDYSSGTDHGGDPVSIAGGFEAAGAPWIHMVDLDAARTGTQRNLELIAAVAGAVSVPVQAGGGVRDEASASRLADAGVSRVVVGTAVVERPELIAQIAARQRVAVGLDVRGDEVAVRGWTAGTGVAWRDVLPGLAGTGAEAVVVTQIRREGMMQGPDLAGLAEVLSATSLGVIASGGVSSVADLLALAALEAGGRRLAGAIVGTAIYDGAVAVAEAVEVLGCARPA
jgi:phosphoribosylformimino-5-aminoimidazole carboxamide ribotide isomerase